MSYPIFLDIDQTMEILMAEMPSGVYAQDLANNPNAAMRSFSSSEIRAHAYMYAQLESNLETIWEDKFATTVSAASISKWQKDYFSNPQDNSQPLEVQRSNLIAKIRATGGLSYPYIYSLIDAILTPLGLTFDLLACTGPNQGEWILDLSELDVSTYLAFKDPLSGVNLGGSYSLDCNAILALTGTVSTGNAVITGVNDTAGVNVGAPLSGPGIPANTTVASFTSTTITMSQPAIGNGVSFQVLNYVLAGLSAQDLADIQATAYTYYVLIYGTASAMTLAQLDTVLTAAEPAGSTHVITNNAPDPIDPNQVDMGPGAGAYLIDQIDCGTGLVPGATYDVWDFNI